MELFNKLKNNSLQATVRAINTIHRTNQPISKPELEKRITNNSSLSPQEQHLMDALFVADTADKNLLWPVAAKAVPIIPTVLEMKWLKEMLQDPRIDCLISASLKEKLQQAMPQDSNSEQHWQQTNWHTPIQIDKPCFRSAEYKERFKTALEALNSKHYVYYESYDIYGNKYKGEAVPYKIEYCSNTNSFNFIMWNEAKQWTFKSDFATITKLQLLPQSFDCSKIELADAYVERLKTESEPIVLQFDAAQYNVFERCFNIFSNYDKEISRFDKDTYQLKIFARDHFDNAEIVQNILSLGSSIVVSSPQKLRQQIIAAIQESFTR